MTKLLVVGAGIFGLSTAWSAVKQGAKVEIVEQAAIPNPIGSSVDQHRLIRYP
jgi:glycine/D-amino acid oxidase-like deaminating enzyme